MNPHETLDILTRWQSAGLDPDVHAAEVASWFLAYLLPAKDHAYVCALYSRAWRCTSEEVRVLVGVVVAVGEA